MAYGQLREAIAARESTISLRVGQMREGGALVGRLWMYSGVYFMTKSPNSCLH